MKIMYVGDPHLEKMATTLGEKHLTMQLDLIHRIVEVGIAKKITHVAVLGDIFDSAYPQQHTQRAFLRLLSQYDNLEWLVYSGNHDRDDVNTCSLDLLSELPEAGALKHVTFCKTPDLIKWGDARVQVIPWGGKVKPVPDEADFVFFHHALIGAKMDTGLEYTKGLSRTKFKGKPAIGGDLHTPQRIKNALYPGTPAQLTFGEPLPKQLWYGEFTKREGLVNKRVKNWEPPWKFKTVRYDSERPPACDEDGVLYKLRIPRGQQPDPRWLLDHPQIVRTEGDKLKGKKAEEVASVTGVDVSADEKTMLEGWLKKNTNLDDKQLRRAVRLDESLLSTPQQEEA